jgi:hypothetical protein
LNQDVREVKVGRLWQVLREKRLDAEGILNDVLKCTRGCRGDGGDQEDLDDLEGKVCILRKELPNDERRDASLSSANYKPMVSIVSRDRLTRKGY